MMDFLNLKPESFGLDISDLSLKMAKLKKKGSFFKLASFAECQIKPGIVKKGEIRDEKALVKIIKKALTEVKGEKLGTKSVVASLPEEKAFLQVIQMPRLPLEDLKSAVIYEAENYIPMPIEEVYLDSQIILPVQDHLDHYDVLIAALPKNMVDSYLSCIKEAGLNPLAFEIESLAISRALIKDETTTSPVLIVDLGATRSSFIIFSGRSLRFTCSISISAQDLTQAVSQSLKIDSEKAEKLKLKYGITNRTQKEGEGVFEALIPPLTDLVEQINKYLNYYKSHSSHEHLPPNGGDIKKILLCGGGANLKGLARFLTGELNLQAELANPWVNILPGDQKEIPGMPFEGSLSYVTALGLALRGLRNKK